MGNKQTASKKPMSKAKLALAIFLCVAAGVFFAVRYTSVRQLGRPAPPPSAGGPRSPEQMEKQRQEFVTELQLSSDQVEKLKEISSQFDRGGPPPLGEVLKAMGPHMSPDQQARARNYMNRKMEERVQQAAKVLPPAELEKYRGKLQGRMKANEPRPPSPSPPPPK